MTGTNPHGVGKTSGSGGPSTCLLGVNLVRPSSATAGRRCLIRGGFPRFNPLYLTGEITHVACNVRVCRRLAEAVDLLERRGRPHAALDFDKELVHIARQIKVLIDEERLCARQERTVPSLTRLNA